MTRLTRPVTRRTQALSRGRELVVTLDTHCLTLRESGRRSELAIPLRAVWEAACKIEAARKRAEKRGRR
jgi:hypothetical protein